MTIKRETRLRWIDRLKLWGKLILNWRFLVCFGIGWMITNGWSYLAFGIGVWLNSKPLITIGGAYLAFLWLPISPEKVVTFAIGFFLVRRLFPKHYHSLRSQIEEAAAKSASSSDACSEDNPQNTQNEARQSATVVLREASAPPKHDPTSD